MHIQLRTRGAERTDTVTINRAAPPIFNIRMDGQVTAGATLNGFAESGFVLSNAISATSIFFFVDADGNPASGTSGVNCLLIDSAGFVFELVSCSRFASAPSVPRLEVLISSPFGAQLHNSLRGWSYESHASWLLNCFVHPMSVNADGGSCSNVDRYILRRFRKGCEFCRWKWDANFASYWPQSPV